jgi:membrane fusion protein (multidrug efflux system)
LKTPGGAPVAFVTEMNDCKQREQMNTNLNQRKDRVRRAGATLIWRAATSLALLAASGCGRGQNGGPTAPPPPEVGVVTIQAGPLPITTELPGRIDAVRTAEVQARVAGILLKEVYQEGSDVKAGDVLFQIDPAPLQASYDGAKASLAKAEASLKQAQAEADRYETLVKIHAVSKQDYETAVSTAAQDAADVLTAKAALETAGLNLGYATVTAPISGRIGKALATEGALVGQNTATELAVIQQLNPIYFDFTQSSVDVLRLRKQLENGQLKSIAPGEANIRLLLEDGTVYPLAGKLLFSDITVDPTTGMVTLRAEFSNPDDWLLPGMFARAQLEQAVDSQAITVPQRGVTYGADGKPSVMVVTPDDTVEVRAVTVSSAAGNQWIVTSGLKSGDRVILEGLQKIQPGMPVKPVPFDSNSTNSPVDNASSQAN